MNTDKICAYLHEGRLYHAQEVHPAQAKPIVLDSVIGRRMQERTLQFLFLAALKAAYPDADARFEHSFSHGVYIELRNVQDFDSARIQSIMDEQIALGTAIFKRQEHNQTIYRLLDCEASFYDALLADVKDLKYRLCHYQNGIWLSLQDQLIDSPKLFQVFQEFERWGRSQGIASVADLNHAVETGRLNEVVLIAEAMAERKLMEISTQIVENKKRFVLIAGPSSAGKTTTSKRLGIHLKVLGRKVFALAMDDFYKNREDTPKKADGSYDFECVEAIDLDYFKQVLDAMKAGQPVRLPVFDFITGTRRYKEELFTMPEDAIVIIEGIHGLNPIMKQYVPMEDTYRLYINALTHLNLDDHNYIMTNDYRLIRRIARDQKTRGRTAEQVILARESVAEGEYRYIYPYQEESDCIMNTSLMYELAVLKTEVEPRLKEVSKDSAAAYDAQRLLAILNQVQAGDVSCIPRSSVLQEFLVNSIFEEMNE